MPIPLSISRDDVIAAMNTLGADRSKWPQNRMSRYYEVVHPTERRTMPPKLVMWHAVRMKTGRDPVGSYGGTKTGSAVDRLKKLGFDVIDLRKI